jgi:hypothetical protein
MSGNTGGIVPAKPEAVSHGVTLSQVSANPMLRALYKLAIRAEEEGDRYALDVAVDAIKAEQERM